MTDSIEQAAWLVNGMVELADDYTSGRISFYRLVGQLKGRISTLEGLVDKSWVEELRTQWGNLEIENAVWLESGEDSLNEEQQRYVTSALDEFRSMLTTWLNATG